jgi:SAM-dependent methyltransferase
VLDFGCGTGENVANLMALGHAVVGIDPVPEMIARAKDRLRAVEAVSVGDLGSLSKMRAEAFDVVTALNVLPYLSEDEEREFYIQAKRITKKDGFIIVSHTNELVDLITFNRYTVEFWRDRIIPHLTDCAQIRDELLEVLRSHLAYPERPLPQASHKSERDFLRKRRVNPIAYPWALRQRFGLIADEIVFTHFYPMPPQFMESSEKYRDLVFAFEEKMRSDEKMGTDPLAYVFASIVMFRLRKDG